MQYKTALGLGGFLVLALLPSYIDFQEADTARKSQIVLMYGGALTLIYFGILKP